MHRPTAFQWKDVHVYRALCGAPHHPFFTHGCGGCAAPRRNGGGVSGWGGFNLLFNRTSLIWRQHVAGCSLPLNTELQAIASCLIPKMKQYAQYICKFIYCNPVDWKFYLLWLLVTMSDASGSHIEPVPTQPSATALELFIVKWYGNFQMLCTLTNKSDDKPLFVGWTPMARNRSMTMPSNLWYRYRVN